MKNEIDYYVADFETTSYEQYLLDGHTRVFMWYIENIYTDTDNALGLDLLGFHHWITRGSNTKKVIFFHNLSFDILFYEYFLNEQGYHCVEAKPLANEYSIIRDDTNNVYALYIKVGSVEIEFRDSLKLLQSSVARLPNERGIEKLGDFDYKKLRYEKSLNDFSVEEIQYIKHDVWKVKDVLKVLLDDLGDHLTIASSSYDDWMDRYNKDNKWNYKNDFSIIERDDEILIRRAYNGGIVILNNDYRGRVINDEIIKLDVNSMYPAMMRNKYLPFGSPVRILDTNNLKHLKRRKYNLFIYQVDVKRMIIKEGYHPFVDTSKNYTFGRKKSYPNEITNTVFMWTNIDLDDIKKYYDIEYSIIYYNSFAFKSKNDTFSEYIDHYYTLRQNSKNIFENMFAKFRLNTLYGKYGSRKERSSLQTKYNDDGLLSFDVVDNESKKEYYLPLAVFITSYARNELITHIQAEREGFIYADTDSIHVLKSKFKGKMYFHKTELGAWDNEGTAVKSVYVNNKQYINIMSDGKRVRRIASLNRSSHHKVNLKNMKIGTVIINGKKMKRHVKGGYVIVETNFTFN